MGVPFVLLAYALALLAAVVCPPDGRVVARLGWSLLLYGWALTLPLFYRTNDAPGYAAGGLTLAGAILLARGAPYAGRALFRVLFVLLFILAAMVWLDATDLMPTGSTDLFRAGGMRRASGVLFSPLPAGEDAAMLLGLAMGLLGDTDRRWRFTALLALPLAVGAVVLTVSRGAILGAFALLLAGGLRLPSRSDRRAAWATLGFGVLMLLVLRDAAVRTAGALVGESSAAIRLVAWRETPGVLLAHPFGGAQNDPQVLGRFDGNGALSLVGQMGLVGGLPLVALLLVLLSLAARRGWGSLGEGSPGRGPALAALGWTVAEGFSEPFPDPLHSPFLWATLGLIWLRDSASCGDRRNIAPPPPHQILENCYKMRSWQGSSGRFSGAPS